MSKQSNRKMDQDLLSKLKISESMHETLAQLAQFLDNLFKNASLEDEYPAKKRKKYLIKSNSSDSEINENIQNILKDFLENPQLEQKVLVEDKATKDKLLENTNKFLESLSEENIIKLQDYYLKDELPKLYFTEKTEQNKEQTAEGQKFSIDLMKENVKKFLEKHSLTIAANREKENGPQNDKPRTTVKPS